MDLLTKVVDKYDAKFIVFVDAAYILRLSQLSNKFPGLKEDLDLVSSHIKKLEDEGHDVELHFHPQWLYSEFENGQWKMDVEHYKLSDMPNEEVTKYFKDAKCLLDDIIGRKTIAFRAGGYSLNSYSNYITLFEENGILIDSSVTCRDKVEGRFQAYDYSLAPKKSSWKFQSDVNTENHSGRFTEYSITTTPRYSGLRYSLLKYHLSKKFGKHKIMGDGFGIDNRLTKKERYLSLLHKFFVGKAFQASIDNMMSENLLSMFRMTQKSGDRNFVVIGHPKEATIKASENLDKFMGEVAAQCNFTTFKDLI